MPVETSPARFIRKSVFGIRSQAEFGQLLGYSDAQISRIETGARPLSAAAQQKIREAARRRKIAWDNNWFFEVPSPARPAQKERCVVD